VELAARPIAFVRNERRAVLDDDWDAVVSTIEFVDEVPIEALWGLEEFSHVEVVFFAALAEDVPPAPWHRHPRGNERWPDVGIFAQRNKDRPNRLMLSIAAIERVEARSLIVRGLDALDATPVLDVKPVYSWSGPRGELRVAPWSTELGEHYF
jgi:tRNA (Thr-GGU) A37 N-methylase